MSQILSINSEDLDDLDDIEGIILDAKKLIRQARDTNHESLHLRSALLYCEQSDHVKRMNDDELADFLDLPLITKG